MNIGIRPWAAEGGCFLIVGGSQGQRDLLFERIGEYEPADELVKDKERLKYMMRSSPPKLLRFKYYYNLDVHYFLYNQKRGHLTYAIEIEDIEIAPWHYFKQARKLTVFALEHSEKLIGKLPPEFPFIMDQLFALLKTKQWAVWEWKGEAFYLPRQTTVEPEICE